MRTRLTLLFVAIALMAGFAALNWGEFVRPAQLSWGFSVGEAPLSLILLGLLALSWVGFLIGSAYLDTHYQLAAHRNAKALEVQRDLADRAEASRFNELRSYLEAQSALASAREAAASARLEHTAQRDKAELLAAIDKLNSRAALYPVDVANDGSIRRDLPTPH